MYSKSSQIKMGQSSPIAKIVFNVFTMLVFTQPVNVLFHPVSSSVSRDTFLYLIYVIKQCCLTKQDKAFFPDPGGMWLALPPPGRS